MEKEVALTRTDIWSEFDESADIYEVTNTRAVAGLGVSLSHSALECDKPSLQIVFQGDSSGICACLQRHWPVDFNTNPSVFAQWGEFTKHDVTRWKKKKKKKKKARQPGLRFDWLMFHLQEQRSAFYLGATNYSHCDSLLPCSHSADNMTRCVITFFIENETSIDNPKCSTLQHVLEREIRIVFVGVRLVLQQDQCHDGIHLLEH